MRRAATVGVLALGIATGALVGVSGFAAAQISGRKAPAPGSETALTQAAAHEFDVPVRLLLAISYVETRWQRPNPSPSIDGGYGVMNLTAARAPAQGGRGAPGTRGATRVRGGGTLDAAARLLALPVTTLEHSERQNIRGAAAVLAQHARAQNGGALPRALGRWYGSVAQYSGATTAQAATTFADEVFAVLGRGAALRTASGEGMRLPATPYATPDRAQLARLHLAATSASRRVDCPHRLHCTFVPAGYARDGKSPANYGNYATARRPNAMRTPSGHKATMAIRYIIIHDTEGSYSGTISVFQNPRSYVSANYVVRSSDGAVTEMVRPKNVSWGAANWYVNMHAINIENEGFAAQGTAWYTPAEYRSDAALVRYLAAKFHIPLDRQHILGHEEVPGETNSGTAAQHWDPGPFWNWNHLMALVHRVGDRQQQARGGSRTRGHHHLVTIDPTFASNKPAMTGLPPQPANFVYLRTGPGRRYPLISDPILGPGTTVDSNWGDKATIGETFVFAGRSGNWTAIWFGGQKAWFHNPAGKRQRARYLGGTVVTPRAGRKSMAVYGAAYPEASAYPRRVRPLKLKKLAYTIPAGQAYPTAGLVATDFYYAPTINSSRPDDHTLIIGTRAYYEISFNHRRFFVRASQSTVRTLP